MVQTIRADSGDAGGERLLSRRRRGEDPRRALLLSHATWRLQRADLARVKSDARSLLWLALQAEQGAG